MWQNLRDETRKRIAEAGIPAHTALYNVWDDDPAHAELFTEYFYDNCADDSDRNLFDCYRWLMTKNLRSSYASSGAETKRDLIAKFEEAYGPGGAVRIEWPGEITSWFATRDQLSGSADSLWKAEWDELSGDAEELAGDEEYKRWEQAHDAWTDWWRNNEFPLESIYDHCRERIGNWYKAYYDEVARMLDGAMPVVELDRDYIDSINKVHLDGLGEGDGLACIGFGYYVLMGEFSPGYLKAVDSYDHHWEGTLTMKKRGGAFSPGKVEVTGCYGDDQKWFKEAFRRVSKKEILFS